jgi:type I restriction enzyme, S subunit
MIIAEEIKTLAPWTDTVPRDWQVTRLDAVADVRFSNVDKHTIDGEIPVRLCNYVDVYKNQCITGAIEFMEASAEQREIDKFQIQPGDILATKDSEEPDDIAITALVTENLPGIVCGYHLAMIRPWTHKVQGSFIAWAHQSKQFLAQYEAKAVGVTRFGLSQYAFRSVRLPLPPLPEQTRIAAYLDASCAAIDAAVAAKARQIETLDALRKSKITQAVTHGMNSKVRLQESGQKWLGTIPQHWTAPCLKRLIREPLTYGLNEAAELEDRSLPRYLRITDFDDDGNLRDETFRSLPYEIAREALLEPNDVLFARSGATVGKTFMFRDYKGDACFAGYLIRARTIPWKLNPLFLYHFTKTTAYETWKNLIFTQATIQNISAVKYNYIAVPLPPLDEQEEICEFIEVTNSVFRKLSNQIEMQVQSLTTYRKSLIHECVTGQRRITDADLHRVKTHG